MKMEETLGMMVVGVSDWPKWAVYSGISSMLCVLGSFMVPVVYTVFHSHHEVNSKLLNYGLSLSAGSMLCTSLLKMLGATNKEHGVVVFCGFSAGCFISFILNHIVHSYTSQSLIHCAHSNSEDDLHPEYEERRLSDCLLYTSRCV